MFNSTPRTSAHPATTLCALRPNKTISSQSSRRRRSERKESVRETYEINRKISVAQCHNRGTKGRGETWRSLDAGKNVKFHSVFHVRRGSSSPSCVETWASRCRSISVGNAQRNSGSSCCRDKNFIEAYYIIN